MPPKSSQSVYALADQLGVSVSTVSRVLNQRGGIGAETRRRVLAGARSAGLRPRSGSVSVPLADSSPAF
jgi:DNA-binding LacI/PurR family transcriptional regulator